MPRNNKSARKVKNHHVFINFRLLGKKYGLTPYQRVKLAKEIMATLNSDKIGGENFNL